MILPEGSSFKKAVKLHPMQRKVLSAGDSFTKAGPNHRTIFFKMPEGLKNAPHSQGGRTRSFSNLLFPQYFHYTQQQATKPFTKTTTKGSLFRLQPGKASGYQSTHALYSYSHHLFSSPVRVNLAGRDIFVIFFCSIFQHQLLQNPSRLHLSIRNEIRQPIPTKHTYQTKSEIQEVM